MMIAGTRLIALSLLPALLCMVSCAGGMSFSLREPVEVPEDEIAVLAAQIEEVVLNTRLDEPTASDYKVDQRTGQVLEELDPLGVMVGIDEIRDKVPALAGLHVDNEIVLAAIRGRILRRSAVQEFEQDGCMGEDREGLLQYLSGDWCSRDRDVRNRAAYIVLSENRDRRTIYEQVVEANSLGKSGIERVREIFMEQIYIKAWAGTPLQMPDGTWQRR